MTLSRAWPVATLAALALLTASLGTPRALAQQPLEITGQVVNGTTGAPAPAGIPVRIVFLREGLEVGRWATVTDGDARFRATAPGGGALDAVVSAEFQSVTYLQRLEPVQPGAPVSIVVYEPANPSEVDVIERVAIFVDETGDRSGLSVEQVTSLENPSTTTVVYGSPGIGLPVPAGISDLRVESDFPNRVPFRVMTQGGDVLGMADAVNEPASVVMDTALRPGPHRVVLRYTVTGEMAGRLSFQAPRDLAEFDVLVPEASSLGLDDPGVSVESLPAGDFRRWRLGAVEAGTTQSVELTGLPGSRPRSLLDSSAVRWTGVAVIAVPVLLVLVYGVFIAPRRKRAAGG